VIAFKAPPKLFGYFLVTESDKPIPSTCQQAGISLGLAIIFAANHFLILTLTFTAFCLLLASSNFFTD
jgi:hypothetical protein